MLDVDKVRIRGNMFAFGCWVLNAWMLIKCASEGTCLLVWVLGVECWVMMKCAFEGTCLSLGVCFGLINM